MSVIWVLRIGLVVWFFIGCGDSGDDHWNNHFDTYHYHEHQHSQHSKIHTHSHEHWVAGGYLSNEAEQHYVLPIPKWYYGYDHSWLGEHLHYVLEVETKHETRFD